MTPLAIACLAHLANFSNADIDYYRKTRGVETRRRGIGIDGSNRRSARPLRFYIGQKGSQRVILEEEPHQVGVLTATRHPGRPRS